MTINSLNSPSRNPQKGRTVGRSQICTNFIADYMLRGLGKTIGKIKVRKEGIYEQPIIMTHFQMAEISTSKPKPDNTQD
jgi:hypothetical protein